MLYISRVLWALAQNSCCVQLERAQKLQSLTTGGCYLSQTEAEWDRATTMYV